MLHCLGCEYKVLLPIGLDFYISPGAMLKCIKFGTYTNIDLYPVLKCILCNVSIHFPACIETHFQAHGYALHILAPQIPCPQRRSRLFEALHYSVWLCLMLSKGPKQPMHMEHPWPISYVGLSLVCMHPITADTRMVVMESKVVQSASIITKL